MNSFKIVDFILIYVKSPPSNSIPRKQKKFSKKNSEFFPVRVNRLVEPFAGAAAISIASAYKNISQQFWIDDLNPSLVKLLRLIIEEPDKISRFYQHIWNEQHENSIEHYYQVRSQFNQTQDPRLFLYLLARCVKGSVRYNRQGQFNQSPDKRRKGTRPETTIKKIEAVSQLFKGKCEFINWDYKDILPKVKSTDFVYLDPPYQGVCGKSNSRYYAGINFEELIASLEQLNKKGIFFALSYDGRRDNKKFGCELPPHLKLKKIEIEVGRSSQSTLLGKKRNNR
jgi:DNA adenine methylase